MPAYATKQLVKNAVYAGVGTVGRVRTPRTDGLRVLLYHKVNDASGNPGSVPTALFAEHMELLAAASYRPVTLDEAVAYATQGAPLPPRATLITFDDGYSDTLTGAAPVLQRHGFPAVVFASVGSIGSRTPFPHDERIAAPNPTLAWDDLATLEGMGVRVESHGVTHVRLATLADADAEREVRESKRLLEQRLGRAVVAYAYVKGGKADFGDRDRALLRSAGYRAAFTSVTGSNASDADPFALRRYNVEPYSAGTLELVLRGACDVLAVKDSAAGVRARHVFNRLLRTASK